MAASDPFEPPVVDITVPVHNEAHVLARSIDRLHGYLAAEFPFAWRITIADNASTDATLAEAEALAARLDRIRVVHLDRKGRGLALRHAWTSSDAPVVAYMDVDLSTGLSALAPLVASIVSGHSDLAIGSRLAPGAAVARGPRRELISRAYNRLLRLVFLNRFRDAQCGFKAIRTDVARALLPAVVDDAWFFDTELLLLAERNGLRIHEVPVDWVDDPDSRVDVARTALEDLRGVGRVLRTFLAGGGRVDLGAEARPSLTDDLGRHVVGFALVGLVSTAATLAIFLALRDPLGPIPANLVGLTSMTVVNTWANRRFTFGLPGHADRTRQAVGVLAALVLGAALSTVALLAVVHAHGPRWAECVVLVAAWSVTAAARFALLRAWVFGPRAEPAGVVRARTARDAPGPGR